MRRALAQRENGMVLFGKCFPSRLAIMAACYRDYFATDSNLANGSKYKVFAASTPQVLKTCAASILMATPVSAGFIEQKGGRRASWCKGTKGQRVQVSLHKNHKISVYITTPPRPFTYVVSYQKKKDTGTSMYSCSLSCHSWLATLTLVVLESTRRP